MTDRSELESIVQTIYKARQDNDIDALMAFFDPACSFRIVGSDRLGSMTQTVDDFRIPAHRYDKVYEQLGFLQAQNHQPSC